jgi:hypothetical protein
MGMAAKKSEHALAQATVDITEHIEDDIEDVGNEPTLACLFDSLQEELKVSMLSPLTAQTLVQTYP